MFSLPWRCWLALSMVLCSVGTGAPMDVVAQEQVAPPESNSLSTNVPRFSIRSAAGVDEQWFEVAIDPGTSTVLTSAIRNVGDVEAELRTYATNALNPVNGGFSAGTEADVPLGATRWLDYHAHDLKLDPGQVREIDFAIAVPAGTPPGEYVSALVVQTAAPQPIIGTDAFEQIIRSTVSVEITVPGEMTYEFMLGKPVFSPAGEQWAIDVPIANTGTARVRPEGQFDVATSDGEVVATSKIEMGSVYGGNFTSVRTMLPGQLPLGDYLISVNLTDPATGASDSIEDAPVKLEEPRVEVVDEAPVFEVNEASVTANADPVQFAEVSATITNNGQTIPTSIVTLNVQRDGDEVESYPLAENLALAQGETSYDQRYIPLDGWQPGTYTFELVIASVSGGTETIIATIEVPDEITVP